MLALQVTALKPFMNALLSGDLFDIFLLEEAKIATAATYTIDGRVNTNFFPLEERDDKTLHPFEFTPWSDMKGLCFNLIKGKRTPLHFQFVFHLMPVHAACTNPEIADHETAHRQYPRCRESDKGFRPYCPL